MSSSKKKPSASPGTFFGTPRRALVTIGSLIALAAIIDPTVVGRALDRIATAIALGIGPSIGPLFGLAIAVLAIMFFFRKVFR